MRKLLLAAVALGGFSALAASGAVAAPRDQYDHRAPERPMMAQTEQRPMMPRHDERPRLAQAEYYHNHHHYHHRHYEHGRWHYWD